MRNTLLAIAALACSAVSQTCPTGTILLKNDIHPATPPGPTQVAVVPGLCIGEAAISVFNVTGPVTVNSVSCMFANSIGTPGVQAAVDVEIYDGVTYNAGAGTYVPGPLVYKLSNFGSNLQVQTHGINTHTIPLSAPVRITSGQLVVGFRMIQTLASGSCLFGYTSNFATDFSGTCTPGRNVIDAQGHGWIDPAVYTGFGVPMCNFPTPSSPYWSGDWMIRACVTPEISVQWQGIAQPGSALPLTFDAPGHAGEYYLALASTSTAIGWNTPWGRIPLDYDFLMDCSVQSGCHGQLFANGAGILNPSGQNFGLLLIPPLPILVGSNFPVHVAFITSTSSTLVPFSAISPPTSTIIIN